jgi:hypothetical protein
VALDDEEEERDETEERMEGESLMTVMSSWSSSMRIEGGWVEGERERREGGEVKSEEEEGGAGGSLNRVGGPQPTMTASCLWRIHMWCLRLSVEVLRLYGLSHTLQWRLLFLVVKQVDVTGKVAGTLMAVTTGVEEY